MTPDIVVDVGNSRIKWGRCSMAKLEEVVALPHNDPGSWKDQFQRWQVSGKRLWVATGVNPEQRDNIMDWLRRQGQEVHILDSPQKLPLTVRLERPDHVGVDRLLNALAANSRRQVGQPAVLVDAGSAVTVDWLDPDGAFCGGAIFPGFRLMTRALHSHTALLPLVEIKSASPALPAVNTPAAIEAGVFWAAVGGINTLVGRLCGQANAPPAIFLAGGDAQILEPQLNFKAQVWPEMTLEGIRLAASGLAQGA